MEVCMTCLDTDGKMSPISQYNLQEAYENLTGHPMWDGGNLKQTLCVQCAQQWRNFSRFREQSLRARSLMMELLEKHELITIQHLKMIQEANSKLRNNLVSTTLEPDPCDMYIVDNTDGGRQTGSEETPCTVHGVTVKVECIEGSQWEDEDAQRIEEDSADCVKEGFNIEVRESAAFTCSVCCEKFPHELAYSAHARTHLHDDASDNQVPKSDHRTNTDLKSCVVQLYDIVKYPKNAKVKVELSPPTLQTASSRDSLYAHTAREDAQHRAASEDEVAATHEEPAASVPSGTGPGTSGHGSRTRTFVCNVCERAFTQKQPLVRHMKCHTKEPYPCKMCSHTFAFKSQLVTHKKIHPVEKPYSCEMCTYKSAQKTKLDRHIRTHTGEKAYSCKLCSYKCIQNSSLVCHMRTHTGETPYSCKFCSYKCKDGSSLVKHTRTHTGEKPYSCLLCSYKCSVKGSLNKHIMSIHSSKIHLSFKA